MGIKNLPSKIYLQVVGDSEIEKEDDFNKLYLSNEISWCRTKIFKNDVCYVLKPKKDSKPKQKIDNEVCAHVFVLKGEVFKCKLCGTSLGTWMMREKKKLK